MVIRIKIKIACINVVVVFSIDVIGGGYRFGVRPRCSVGVEV